MDASSNFPSGYMPDEVWSTDTTPGAFGGMNRPTAGPRSHCSLPIGEHPLQLYSLGTPNGQKVTILLEELVDVGAISSYDAWKIGIMDLQQFTTGFTAINPNGKIPALVDHSVNPPQRVFESGSILLYLADKYRRFVPCDPAARAECLSWLFWQMGTGPFMGGGFGHFYKYAPVKIKYAIDRYAMETKRIIDVLERHLAGIDPTVVTQPGEEQPTGAPRKYIMGDDFTIADMAIMPWIICIETGYSAGQYLQLDKYTHVAAWVARILARPAAKRGMRVNAFGPDAVPERHSLADFGPSTAPAAEDDDLAPCVPPPNVPGGSGSVDLANVGDDVVGGRLIRLVLTAGGVPFHWQQDAASGHPPHAAQSPTSEPVLTHGKVRVVGATAAITYAAELGVYVNGIPTNGGPANKAAARALDATLVGLTLRAQAATVARGAATGDAVADARQAHREAAKAALDAVNEAIASTSAVMGTKFVYGDSPSVGDCAIYDLVRGDLGVSAAHVDAMQSHPRLAKVSSAVACDPRFAKFEEPLGFEV